ncbi:MAG: tail fiber domain-containing protein [Salinivirgaceae bacterium]|nr:tail fiber domain-containing protein [Salinivirgaceae bacterium]
MKKMFLMLITVAFAMQISAQSFSYQAVVRNAKGEVLKSTKVPLTITLVDKNDVVVYYSETQEVSTNNYGILTANVGEGKPIGESSLANVDWASNDVWMKVLATIDGKAVDFGKTKINAVPYALYAANSNKGDALTFSDLTEAQKAELKGNDGVGIASAVSNPDGTLTINYTDGNSFTTPSLKGDKGDALTFSDLTEAQKTELKGNDGVGIASTVNNPDGTLTINYTDGNSFTTPSLKGDKGDALTFSDLTEAQKTELKGNDGVGIASTVNNPDGTLTINYTNGNSFTTGNLKGPKGDPGIGLTNQGAWVSGKKYNPGDYVFASNNGGYSSMWIVQSATEFISSVEPKNDASNWVEFSAPQGEIGKTGVGIASTVSNPDGTLTINYTNGTSYTTSSLKGPKGDDGMNISGTKGQTLRHNGTTWVANDAIYNSGNRIGIGITAPTQKLDIDGNLRVRGSIYDYANSKGTNGQVLTSTSTGTKWQDPTSEFKSASIQAASTAADDEALFEVKDKEGNVVFAVYPTGTVVYANDDDSKAAKSAFAVRGRSGAKGETDILSVGTDGTTVYVDEDGGKAAKSAFAVRGRSGAKGENDIFAVNTESTTIYVDDDDSKAAKSAFAVRGRSGAKGENDIFAVNTESTTVYVDDDDSKAAKSAFAVRGRSGAKGDNDIFAVNTEATTVYVDDDDSKAAKSAFAVRGRSGAKGDNDIFAVNTEATTVYVDDDDSKAAKSAFAVRGRSGAKGENDILAVNTEATTVYVDDDDSKAAKSAFAVRGRSGAKGENNILAVNTEETTVYVDDDDSKAAKSAFAVRGRSGAKGTDNDMFMVTKDNTSVHVSDESAENGFSVSGKKADGTNQSYMDINQKNYLIGLDAGQKITTGTANSFMGNNAGAANTSGYNNVFLGYQVGTNNETGKNNVFVGTNAGYSNWAGSDNVIVGNDAGKSIVTATSNVIIGEKAGWLSKSSQCNILIGRRAGQQTTGQSNVFIGDYAGSGNMGGEYNVMIGDEAGYSNTSGTRNVAIGFKVAWLNTSGSDNVMIGNKSGFSNTTGKNNVAVGNSVGYSNTRGENNVFLGWRAAYNNTTGSNNTMLGLESGFKNTISWHNVFIGWRAGYHYNNTESTDSNKGGNVFVGDMAGFGIGNGNTSDELDENVKATGRQNSFFGYYAGYKFNSGDFNTFIGSGAGRNLVQGSRNVFIGYDAGYNETGSNKLYIANSSTTTPLIYGDFSAKTLRINGALTYTSASASSDARLKKDVQTLGSSLGNVLKLRGVTYYWKSREEMAALKGVPTDSLDYCFNAEKQIGVIAQEVEAIYPELVSTDENGYKSVSYEKFTPILIEAIKEQQGVIDNLKSESDKLQSTVNTLQQELEAMKLQMQQLMESMKK